MLWYIVELTVLFTWVVGGEAICSSTISSSIKPLDVGEISSLSESVIVEDEEDGVGVRVGVRVGVGVTLLPVVVELFRFESVVKDSSKGIDVTSSFSLSSLLSKDVEAFNEIDDEV